jgi:hypothetical protein
MANALSPMLSAAVANRIPRRDQTRLRKNLTQYEGSSQDQTLNKLLIIKALAASRQDC